MSKYLVLQLSVLELINYFYKRVESSVNLRLPTSHWWIWIKDTWIVLILARANIYSIAECIRKRENFEMGIGFCDFFQPLVTCAYRVCAIGNEVVKSLKQRLVLLSKDAYHKASVDWYPGFVKDDRSENIFSTAEKTENNSTNQQNEPHLRWMYKQ